MTALLLAYLAGSAVAALVTLLAVRGYYRAAWGDRYERGFQDGQERQIRYYQNRARTEVIWQETARRPPWRPALPPGQHRVTPSRRAIEARDRWLTGLPGPAEPPPPGSPHVRLVDPAAADPPPRARRGPGPGTDPVTSEWARDLIRDVETWNAQELGG